MAAVCSILTGYPLWAGEKAISEAVVESKFIPPAPGILKPLLEGQVATARYVDHWENVAGATIRQLAAPRGPRLTMDELRAKYGPNWGIATGAKPKLTQAQAEAELIAQIGQEAFDDLPPTNIRTDDWQKLRAPKPQEAAE